MDATNSKPCTLHKYPFLHSMSNQETYLFVNVLLKSSYKKKR